MSDGHVALPDSHREQSADRVRDVDPSAHLEVTVTLRAPDLPEFDASKPAMSREDFAARYGASSEDVAKVRDVLEQIGLTIEGVSETAHSVRVSGTAAQMEEVFHPRLGIYHTEEQGDFRGRAEGELQIPAALEGIVTGVFGLDERRVAHRRSSQPASAHSHSSKPAPLGPHDLEQRYNFPPGEGKGQKIGIAEFGGAYFSKDLEAFCAKHKIAEAPVSVISAGATPPTTDEIEALPEAEQQEVIDDSIEVMMDVQIIAGLCPQSEILLYFSTFDQKGWIDLLDKALTPGGPPVLSVSWGLAEDSPHWSKSALKQISRRLGIAAHLGMTVCLASGDDGSGDQLEDGKAHVDFPGSSPWTLCVGGTMIKHNDDVVWWESPGRRTEHGGGATGGGVSVIFDRPTWQNVQVTSVNKGSIDGRICPDIAALAGEPLYDLIFLGKSLPNGGTSAATPLWAALIARLLEAGKPSQGPTFLAPLLYEAAPNGQPRGQTACTDVTKGDNTSTPPGDGYTATTGYDAVSGWGVPNGQELLDALP
jgi:kumamolisin